MNSVSEMIGRVKSYVWNRARRKVPVGQILPPWLLVVHAVLFPLDTLFFTLGKGRGYQFQRDVWIIGGMEISTETLRSIFHQEGEGKVIVSKSIDGAIRVSRPVYNFMTGSSETEGELRLFAQHADGDLNAGVPRSVFTNEYYWKIMTIGRNGPGDPYPGSECFDDTGGFFIVGDDGLVYLTEKAKGCARLW